jgi:hypothetical protein
LAVPALFGVLQRPSRASGPSGGGFNRELLLQMQPESSSNRAGCLVICHVVSDLWRNLALAFSPCQAQNCAYATEEQMTETEKDAARWRYISTRMTYENCGPNYGWTLSELLEGPDSAVDAAMRKEGK